MMISFKDNLSAAVKSSLGLFYITLLRVTVASSDHLFQLRLCYGSELSPKCTIFTHLLLR